MTADKRYPMTAAEYEQRRIDTCEWHPDVMTDAERIAARRMDAAYAFEVMPEAEYQRRIAATPTERN